MVARLFFMVLLLVVTVPVHTVDYDYNILDFDNATMALLVGKSRHAFVRFDKDYSYGEEADAFKALARRAVGSNLIIGTVGLGFRNLDLAERYGYKTKGKDLDVEDMDKSFPKFRFFAANESKEIEYTDVITTDAMIRFLKNEAKVYFSDDGTIRSFDMLATEFVKGSDRAATLTKAKAGAAAASHEQQDIAAHYVEVMEKMQEEGVDWAQKEHDHINQMLQTEFSKTKKTDMQLKMNRLHAFISPHDEL